MKNQTSAYIDQIPTDFVLANMDKAKDIFSRLDGLVSVWHGHNNLFAHLIWKWGDLRSSGYGGITLHDVLVRLYFFKPVQKKEGSPFNSNHIAAKDYLADKKGSKS